MCNALDIDPFDVEGIELGLDVLHNAAFPDPRVRPQRILLDVERTDPRVNYV